MYRWTVFRELSSFNLTVVFAYSVVLSPDCIYNYLGLLIITYLLSLSVVLGLVMVIFFGLPVPACCLVYDNGMLYWTVLLHSTTWNSVLSIG